MKNNNPLITGLKLLFLNFIAGIIAMFFIFILSGLFTIDIGMSGLIFYSLMTLAIIFVNGWLAQKIWKWR